jgi:O-succinylbenzoic acid--CoA ligase
MPSGQLLIDRLSRAWDNDDAVFPLDQRLPAPARKQILDIVQPTIMATLAGDERVPGRHVETGDAVVVATSGTTGTQKAAVLTMSAVEASAKATSVALNVSLRDQWLACLPASHVGGLSVITRSLVMGTSLIAVPSFTTEAYEAAAREGATLVSLVTTAFQRIDPSLYRKILLGGSRTPRDLPSNCVTTYGMTETGSGIVYNGKALPTVEIEIRDSIVYVRAPMLLRAYRDDTCPLDEDGWLRTGDRGSLSADGVLTIEGREGDLIISGGENIWPESVEETLLTHKSVAEVCVAGVPDPEWGMAVHAWVIVKDSDTVSLEDLRNHVKLVMPAHCAPRQIHVVATIPRTAIGKPQRSLLVGSLTQF